MGFYRVQTDVFPSIKGSFANFEGEATWTALAPNLSVVLCPSSPSLMATLGTSPKSFQRKRSCTLCQILVMGRAWHWGWCARS